MLCEIAGINLSHYSAVERGESAITIQKLFQIATALGIPMRHLLSGEPGRPSSEKKGRIERSHGWQGSWNKPGRSWTNARP